MKEEIQIGLVMVLIALIVVVVFCPFFIIHSGGNISLHSNYAKAAIAASVDDIYVFSFSNKTGNDEIMFKSSTDGGLTFSNTVGFTSSITPNLKNVELSSDNKNIIISWSERNASGKQLVNDTTQNDGVTLGIVLLPLKNETTDILN